MAECWQCPLCATKAKDETEAREHLKECDELHKIATGGNSKYRAGKRDAIKEAEDARLARDRWKDRAVEAEAELKQAKEAISKMAKDERLAAVYEWLDKNPNKAIKIASDETGRLETDLVAANKCIEEIHDDYSDVLAFVWELAAMSGNCSCSYADCHHDQAGELMLGCPAIFGKKK